MVRYVSVAIITFGGCLSLLGLASIVVGVVRHSSTTPFMHSLYEALPWLFGGLVLVGVGLITRSVDEIARHFRAEDAQE